MEISPLIVSPCVCEEFSHMNHRTLNEPDLKRTATLYMAASTQPPLQSVHFIQWLLSSCSTSKWPYFQSPKHELLKVNLRYLCPETVRSQKRSKVVSQNWNQEARRTFQLSETWKHEARRTSGQKIFGLIHQKFSRTRYVFDFLKRTWNLQIYQRNKLLSMFSKFSSWFFP